MKIDENTKVIARFHHQINNRSLNIYNPYFQTAGINAVYLLFQDKNPEILIDGLRKLNLAGAINAGFENDPRIINLVDELHPISKRLNAVGIIINDNGKLFGMSQAAFGLDESIRRLTQYSDKKMVILGAGHVVKALLILMEMNKVKPAQLEIYNRTVQKAENLKSEFKDVTRFGTIEQMIQSADGDIFINATEIGSPWNSGEDFIFPEALINRFEYIIDVTFVPLKPQLIQLAEKLKKKVSPGHRMFLYQGKVCLEQILQIKVNETLLSEKILSDFEKS